MEGVVPSPTGQKSDESADHGEGNVISLAELKKTLKAEAISGPDSFKLMTEMMKTLASRLINRSMILRQVPLTPEEVLAMATAKLSKHLHEWRNQSMFAGALNIRVDETALNTEVNEHCAKLQAAVDGRDRSAMLSLLAQADLYEAEALLRYLIEARSKMMSIGSYGTCCFELVKMQMGMVPKIPEGAPEEEKQQLEAQARDCKNAGKRAAKRLLQTMQKHLAPSKVLYMSLAYSWAAIAQTVMDEDPRYAIDGLINNEKVGDATTMKLLSTCAKWYTEHPASFVEKGRCTSANVASVIDSIMPKFFAEANWGRFPTGISPVFGGSGSVSEPKAVCFILDVSGSMAGGRLESTKQNLEMVFTKYVADDDLVAYIEFNNRVMPRHNLAIKKERQEDFLKLFREARAGGQTHFHDAMIHGINMLEACKMENKFIFALTDGDSRGDNYSACEVQNAFQQAAVSGNRIRSFCIGAGTDISHQAISNIQLMVGQEPPHPDDSLKGMYVSAQRTEDLAKAFSEVAQQMAGDMLNEDL